MSHSYPHWHWHHHHHYHRYVGSCRRKFMPKYVNKTMQMSGTAEHGVVRIVRTELGEEIALPWVVSLLPKATGAVNAHSFQFVDVSQEKEKPSQANNLTIINNRVVCDSRRQMCVLCGVVRCGVMWLVWAGDGDGRKTHVQ